MHLFPRGRAAACLSVLSCLCFVSAASAASLTGQVTDPDGRGVAGARVVVASALGPAATAVTDAAGVYEVPQLAAGEYDIRVLADGFHAEPRRVTLADADKIELSLQLHLSALSESIVVSAAQIDLPLSGASDSVTVLSAGELQARQIESVAEALRFVPGLSIVTSGGRGSLTSLFPRGGGSNYTLVLVDGVRTNSFGGGFDFGHLSVVDVDRIEIVRGPQSAVFGSEAIGGVVQIVTRRGGASRADALIEGGSQGTVRAAAGAAGSHAAWSWGAGAEGLRSDGFTGAAANGETVANDDYARRRASASLGWHRPNAADVRLTASFGRDERGFPGPFGSDPIGAFPGVDRIARGTNHSHLVGLRASHPWRPTLRQRVDLSYSDLDSDFASRFGLSQSGTRRLAARLQEDAVLGPGLSASAGIELMRERGSSTFVTGAAGLPIPIVRRHTGGFVELRSSRLERLSATAGVRVERLTRAAVEPDPTAFSPRPSFPDQTVVSVNPKVSVAILASPAGDGWAATRVRASAGTGIRPPDVFEIAFTDNPDLAPERSVSVEVGVEQRLARGALVAAATAFFNRYDDLIVTVGRSLADASRFRTDNISNARARGLELTADARLRADLTLRVAYTFLPTELLSVDGLNRLAPAPFEEGDALIRRPRHQGTAVATYSRRRLSAFVELLSRGRALDLEPNFGSFGGLFSAAGYTSVDAGLSVPLASGVHLFGRVSNLADRSYEETLGYPALGRSAMLGVRFAAGR